MVGCNFVLKGSNSFSFVETNQIESAKIFTKIFGFGARFLCVAKEYCPSIKPFSIILYKEEAV